LLIRKYIHTRTVTGFLSHTTIRQPYEDDLNVSGFNFCENCFVSY